jgi:ABC-2 type transport system ATP-binding protein
MIQIKKLVKKFGDFTAVNLEPLEIKEGEIFGLLGPNGAGKTTTISMLATILKPSEADVKINGFTLDKQDSVRRSIGIVFQDPSLDDELTGRENLELHGRLYHMPSSLRKQRISDVLRLVSLEDKADKQVKVYSGGMKRRLEIARGLMHHPKVLFLDEPTLGLDPQTRRGIWEYVEKLNRDEKLTIILTTHYMDEADYLCNRIGIIDMGKIVAMDTPDKLKGVMGGDLLLIESEKAEELKDLLEFGWIKEVKHINHTLTVTVEDGEKAIPKILEIAEKNRIKIKSVSLKKPTLEDVFIHYTGHAIRDESASAVDGMRMHMKAGMRR